MKIGNLDFGEKGLEERPQCAIPYCENDALIFFGGKFICGNCLEKLMMIEQNGVQKRMNNLLKKEDEEKNYGDVRFG